jgi:hypothetical protein
MKDEYECGGCGDTLHLEDGESCPNCYTDEYLIRQD